MDKALDMRELSLFTGAGGGILGTSLLEWELVGCVEWDDYCQRLLRQRMEDGLIERVPIYGDIRAFISEGYAAGYKGMVDVITAGFPCQPFTTANPNRAVADDPRNMWPATIDCIRMVRPRFALLENVPGLLSSGYFGQVLGDLAESGYDARWRVLSAAEVGGSHLRDRLWIIAHATGTGFSGLSRSHSDRLQVNGKKRLAKLSSDIDSRMGTCDIPESIRMGNDVAYRMDRFKATGNGQVPAVVKAAWELLTLEDFENEK